MTGDLYDAPNQQVVRADGSAPWEEGDGGSMAKASADPLDDMTKAELLDEANSRGVDVNQDMTKAEIKDAIQAG